MRRLKRVSRICWRLSLARVDRVFGPICLLLMIEVVSTPVDDGTGLVLCPITGRRTRFAGTEAVGAAAAGVRRSSAVTAYGGAGLRAAVAEGRAEGPRLFVVFSPGSVRFTRTDLNLAARNREREVKRRRHAVDEALDSVLFDDAIDVASDLLGVDVDAGPGGVSRSRIYEWSRKSRSMMVRRLCSLDWTGLVGGQDVGEDLAMVTLTYPGEWLSVAPGSQACSGHVKELRKRWRRRWGVDLVGVWKREFQRRGAPHYHVLCAPPGGRPGSTVFRRWLSSAWADVVAHSDPFHRSKHEKAGTGVDWNEGFRMVDPKRVAVYFAKHGLLAGKEYQNVAPPEWIAAGEGVGRYWGVWGLPVCEVPVMVAPDEFQAALRAVRRWSQSGTRIVVEVVWRMDSRTGELRRRKVRRRFRGPLAGRAGYLSVNDGVQLAFMVERVVAALG